jgi:hypothetical protein
VSFSREVIINNLMENQDVMWMLKNRRQEDGVSESSETL